MAGEVRDPVPRGVSLAACRQHLACTVDVRVRNSDNNASEAGCLHTARHGVLRKSNNLLSPTHGDVHVEVTQKW